MYSFKETKAEAIDTVKGMLLSRGLNPNDYDLDNIIWSNLYGNRWFIPLGPELDSRAEVYKKEFS